MNKTEQYKDHGLRLALQRKTESAEKMKLPDDFTDRLMQRIEQKESKPKHRRVWLYPTIAAVAASVLLLFTLHRQPSESSAPQPPQIAKTEEVRVVQYENAQNVKDVFYAHQKEIKEKGERLAAYIRKKSPINIE
jgi:hypothetical protein